MCRAIQLLHNNAIGVIFKTFTVCNMVQGARLPWELVMHIVDKSIIFITDSSL